MATVQRLSNPRDGGQGQPAGSTTAGSTTADSSWKQSPGLSLTFFQMLWAVRCPKIQQLWCQEGWQLAKMPRSGRKKKMAWELRLNSAFHFCHLISCMTLKKLLNHPAPSISQGNHSSFRIDTEPRAVIVSGTWHIGELREYWFPLPSVALSS